MPKPTITSMYKVAHVLDDESKIAIVSLNGGRSYQTMKFPAGTLVEIYVSKLPLEEPEEKRNADLQL